MLGTNSGGTASYLEGVSISLLNLIQSFWSHVSPSFVYNFTCLTLIPAGSLTISLNQPRPFCFVLFILLCHQKEFLDHLKKALNSTKHLTESAAVVCVKLCKVATYMKPEDNSVLCFLVVSMLNELKVQYELFSCWDGGLTNGCVLTLLNTQIKLVILLTVNHTILTILVQRIQYWIN